VEVTILSGQSKADSQIDASVTRCP